MSVDRSEDSMKLPSTQNVTIFARESRCAKLCDEFDFIITLISEANEDH